MKGASGGRWSSTWWGSETKCFHKCQINHHSTVFGPTLREKVIQEYKVDLDWYLLSLLTSSLFRSPQKQVTHKPSEPTWAGQLLRVFLLRFWQHRYFSFAIRFNVESLEHLKRRVDYLELSNTFQKQNNVPRQILPEPDDELLSAKLWLLNRSKQINKEKS